MPDLLGRDAFLTAPYYPMALFLGLYRPLPVYQPSAVAISRFLCCAYDSIVMLDALIVWHFLLNQPTVCGRTFFLTLLLFSLVRDGFNSQKKESPVSGHSALLA
jgi:hypothetical protein